MKLGAYEVPEMTEENGFDDRILKKLDSGSPIDEVASKSKRPKIDTELMGEEDSEWSPAAREMITSAGAELVARAAQGNESESFSEDGNESNVYHDSFWPSHHQQHQHPPPTQSMGIQYPSGYAYYSAPSRSAQSYSPYLHHPHTHLPQPSMLHYQAGAYPSYYPPHPAQGLAQDRTIPPSGYSYNSFEPSSSTLSNSTGYNISMREGEITGRPPVALYMPCDENSLSEYQCLVRRQIELFEATRHDVESSAQGRNRPIVLGQVGIRCIHCRMLATKRKARGATYYPAKLIGLYQAAQNQASCHLCEHCQHVPVELRTRLLKLKEHKSSAGGGKKYWADSLSVLGVYEDEDGLRFSSEDTAS